MANFADGGGESADADAVAAHYRVLLVALLVKIGHVHRLCVFRAELEYVADLDAAGYLYRVLAALRKVVVFNLADIARNVETDIVVVLFVRAAGEVSGTLERVVEQNCHVLRQTDRAYKARVKSAFLGDNCGMNRLAEQVCELRFVYVKIAADKNNNIFVRRVLLIHNSLA